MGLAPFQVQFELSPLTCDPARMKIILDKSGGQRGEGKHARKIGVTNLLGQSRILRVARRNKEITVFLLILQQDIKLLKPFCIT
jgi:hypothetical protein